MSNWRNVALVEVPTCKRVIEGSLDPAMMWTELYDALVAAYDQEPADENVISQIYTFALLSWKSVSSKRSDYMTDEVGRFFERVLLIDSAAQQDVVNRVPERELRRLRSTFTQLYETE